MTEHGLEASQPQRLLAPAALLVAFAGFVFSGQPRGRTISTSSFSEIARARPKTIFTNRSGLKLAQTNPAFVVTVGDTIQGLNDTTAEAEWQEAEKILGRTGASASF